MRHPFKRALALAVASFLAVSPAFADPVADALARIRADVDALAGLVTAPIVSTYSPIGTSVPKTAPLLFTPEGSWSLVNGQVAFAAAPTLAAPKPVPAILPETHAVVQIFARGGTGIGQEIGDGRVWSKESAAAPWVLSTLPAGVVSMATLPLPPAPPVNPPAVSAPAVKPSLACGLVAPDYVSAALGRKAALLRGFDFSRVSYNATSIAGVDWSGGVAHWFGADPTPGMIAVNDGALVLTALKDAAGNWHHPALQSDDGSGTGFFVPDDSFIELTFRTDTKGGGNFWAMPLRYFKANANPKTEEDFIEVVGGSGQVVATMHSDTGTSGDTNHQWWSAPGLANQSHVWGFRRPGPGAGAIAIYMDGAPAQGTDEHKQPATGVPRFANSGGPMGLVLASDPNYMDGSGDGGLSKVATTFRLCIWQ